MVLCRCVCGNAPHCKHSCWQRRRNHLCLSSNFAFSRPHTFHLRFLLCVCVFMFFLGWQTYTTPHPLACRPIECNSCESWPCAQSVNLHCLVTIKHYLPPLSKGDGWLFFIWIGLHLSKELREGTWSFIHHTKNEQKVGLCPADLPTFYSPWFTLKQQRSCDLNALTCSNGTLTSSSPILCTEQSSTSSSLQNAQIPGKTAVLFFHLEHVKSKANAISGCINQIKYQMRSSFKGQRCTILNST